MEGIMRGISSSSNRHVLKNHPLRGRWREDLDNAVEGRTEYDVSSSAEALRVRAVDFVDGEEHVVTNVQWTPTTIEFDVLTESTGRTGHLKMAQKGAGATMTFTLTEVVPMVNYGAHLMAEVAPILSGHPLIGRWRKDMQDGRTEYDVRATPEGLNVQGVDFMDGEKLRITEVQWTSNSITFGVHTRSTGRQSHLEMIHKGTEVIMLINYAAEGNLVRVDHGS